MQIGSRNFIHYCSGTQPVSNVSEQSQTVTIEERMELLSCMTLPITKVFKISPIGIMR